MVIALVTSSSLADDHFPIEDTIDTVQPAIRRGRDIQPMQPVQGSLLSFDSPSSQLGAKPFRVNASQEPVAISRQEYDKLMSDLAYLKKTTEDHKKTLEDHDANMSRINNSIETLRDSVTKLSHTLATSPRPTCLAGSPLFHGREGEDVHEWISIVEDQLELLCVPSRSWVQAVSPLFRDGARPWYLKYRRDPKNSPLDWEAFKTELIERFCSPFRAAEVRKQLDTLRFRNLEQYLDDFQAIIARLWDSRMTLDDQQAYFFRNLPDEVQCQIRFDCPRPSTMEDLYAAARDWACLERIHRLTFGRSGTSSHYTFPTDATTRVSRSCHSTNLEANRPLEFANVRCYNCNQRGHLSKECSRPVRHRKEQRA